MYMIHTIKEKWNHWALNVYEMAGIKLRISHHLSCLILLTTYFKAEKMEAKKS